MDEQKNPVSPETEETEEEGSLSPQASRARNRTVMLSPDVAGQVRAMLHTSEGGDRRRDPLSEILPPVTWDGGNRTDPAKSAAPAAEPERPGAAGALRSSADAQGYIRPSRKGGTAKFLAQSEAATTPTFTPNMVHPTAPLHGVAPAARVERKSKVIGFLVSYDSKDIGEVFEICQGRWLLTSRASEHGDHIIVDDPTISPLHAIVRVTPDGKVQVLDQLSEYGTGVLRAGEKEEEEVSGMMVNLQHGDRIRFGKRYFTVCLIPIVPSVVKDVPAEKE